jgi:hypothetical protein
MPDPYDYTSAFANLPAPGASFLQGIQSGAALTDLQAQQQQKQIALAQQQKKQQVIQSLTSNPNASGEDYAKASVLVPELSAQFKQAWDMKSAAQQDNQLNQMVQWSSAIQSGQPKIASDGMRAQADAIENTAGAPTPESKALRIKADQVDANPNAANFILKSMIAANPKGKAAIDGIVALGQEQRASDLAPAALRTANAKASGEEADNALKNLGIVAQKAGALAKPGVKPAQAEAMFRTLAAQGVIPKDDLQGYIDGIPSNAKDVPDYLSGIRDSGIKPNEQKKFTTPDANAKLSSDTQVKTTGMNNVTQLAVQKAISDRQDSKGDAEPTLDADTLTTMAQQYLAGDKGVMQNLGRGAQGAANVVALRQAITKEAKAQGLTGPQIAAQMADYQGMTAGIRTSANISARVENAAAEAANLAPLAIAAGREVSRSGFLPFGKLQVMFDTQTNDPKLKRFATANIGLATAYANAMARGQKATVEDNKHSRELLATATSQDAYEAVVNQMLQEIATARKAPEEVRQNLRGQISNRGGHTVVANPVAAPAIPAGWTVQVH